MMHHSSTTLLACTPAHISHAAKRDAEKLAHYRRHGDANYKLVPFAVETLGCLGKPAMDMLRHLGGKYNHRIEQAVASYFAQGAGKSFTRGLSQPDAELSSEDSS
jgi:hypothetical protein